MREGERERTKNNEPLSFHFFLFIYFVCMCARICNLNKSFVILSSHFTSLAHTLTLTLTRGIIFLLILFHCSLHLFRLVSRRLVSPRRRVLSLSPCCGLFLSSFFSKFISSSLRIVCCSDIRWVLSFVWLFVCWFVCLLLRFVCMYNTYIYIVSDRLSAYVLCNRQMWPCESVDMCALL